MLAVALNNMHKKIKGIDEVEIYFLNGTWYSFGKVFNGFAAPENMGVDTKYKVFRPIV